MRAKLELRRAGALAKAADPAARAEIAGLESWIASKSPLLAHGGCWAWKPLIGGKELLRRFAAHGLAKDARFGELIRVIAERRMANPRDTKDDAALHELIVQWLKQHPPPPKSHKKQKKKK